MEDMRTVGEDEVVVNAEEYTTMLEDQHSFFLLVDALLKNAKLSWHTGNLSFSDEDVSLILSLVSPYKYINKLSELQREKEDANGNDND